MRNILSPDTPHGSNVNAPDTPGHASSHVSPRGISRRTLLAALATTPLAASGCDTLKQLSYSGPVLLGGAPRRVGVIYPGPYNPIRPILPQLPPDQASTFDLIAVSDTTLGQAVRPSGAQAPANSYSVLIQTEATGKQVDLVLLDAPRLRGLADSGVLLDLNSVLRGETWYTREEFWPSLFEAGSVGGKQLAVPLEVGIEVLLYNAGRFQSGGAAPPTSNWTWDDLRNTTRRLTARTQSISVFNSYWGMLLQPATPNIVGLAWQNGADVIGAGGNQVTLSEPGTLQALQLLADLTGPRGVAPAPESLHPGQGGLSDSSLLLGNGNAAMEIALVGLTNGDHWWSGLVGSPNLTMARVPRGAEAVVYGQVNWLVGIAAKSPDPGAAAAALKALSDASRTTVWLPARRKGISLPQTSKLITAEEESVLLDSLANLRVLPGGLPATFLPTLANQLVAPILNGARNVGELDRTAQGYVDQLINFTPPPTPTPMPFS